MHKLKLMFISAIDSCISNSINLFLQWKYFSKKCSFVPGIVAWSHYFWQPIKLLAGRVHNVSTNELSCRPIMTVILFRT